MEEIWKDIEGFPYQVSSLGSIKSVGRYIHWIDPRKGRACKRWMPERVLKWSAGTSGYPTTHLYTEDGVRSTVMIHRLVALNFIPLVEGKDFVNHIDGNKLNNHIENLEWVTKSENTLHAIDTGLLKRACTDSNLCKLTEEQVIEIVSLRTIGKGKYFAKDIASRYDICERYVSELGCNEDKWSRLKSTLTEEHLIEVYTELTKDWEPSKFYRTPSKHKLTDEQAAEVIERRLKGDRVCDIAQDFNKPPKFISWFTRKMINDG